MLMVSTVLMQEKIMEDGKGGNMNRDNNITGYTFIKELDYPPTIPAVKGELHIYGDKLKIYTKNHSPLEQKPSYTEEERPLHYTGLSCRGNYFVAKRGSR
jgi:hypothetical protein